MNRYWSIFALFCLGAVSALNAQSIYWSPSNGTLQRGKANNISLIIENCSLEGQNQTIPQAANLELDQAGNSTSSKLINGKKTTQLIINFRATPGQLDAVQIPSFSLETNEGKITVPVANFKVVNATIGNTGLKPEDVFSSYIQANDRKIYEGELFETRYYFNFKQGIQVNGVNPPEWDPQGLITSGFGDFRRSNTTVDGEPYTRLEYRQVAMANKPGTLNLAPANQLASVITGQRSGFGFFSQDNVENVTITSKPVSLTIHPLPEGAPETFYGAIGEFELNSTVVPQEVQIGEPVTWTLSLKGTGNWPSGLNVPPRSVSKDFKAIQPEVKTEFEEDNLFIGTHTEDIILIPTSEGEYKLGPLEYTYFDTKLEQYQTIRIPPTTVIVSPISTQAIDPSNQEQNKLDESPSEQTNVSVPAVELDPNGINMLTKTIDLPAEAIAQSQESVSPPKGKLNALNLLWTPIPAVLVWLIIAIVRAFYFDKNSIQRKALSTLKSIKSSNTNKLDTQEKWRNATCVYWNLKCEEPSASELEAAIEEKVGPEQASLWKSLWLRSDALLYGKATSLGDSWNNDFKKALSNTKFPMPSLSTIGKSIAWKASIVLCMFTLLGASQPLSASSPDEALELYEKGSFYQASKAWSQELEAAPGDWATLHNTGLAHAQQNDWGKALGYWTSAFTLQPQNKSIRWNLTLALNRTGSFDPKLTELLSEDRTSRIVTTFGPTQWESYAQMSLTGIVIIFVVIVFSFYMKIVKKIRWIFLILAALTAAFVVIADWAVYSYGILAEPEALILTQAQTFKSLPTDVAVDQIEIALSEGAIGIAQKKQFGWTQIRLANEEVGWVRTDGLMPLYRQEN